MVPIESASGVGVGSEPSTSVTSSRLSFTFTQTAPASNMRAIASSIANLLFLALFSILHTSVFYCSIGNIPIFAGSVPSTVITAASSSILTFMSLAPSATTITPRTGGAELTCVLTSP